MVFYRAIVFALASLVAWGAWAEQRPIDGAELFQRPRISYPSLNPDATFLAVFLVEDDERGIYIVDLADNIYYSLLRFDNHSGFGEYHWVDNDTLYVTYRVRGSLKQEIIDLNLDDLSKPNYGERIKVPGYLLDPLPHVDDRMVYVQTEPDGSEGEILTVSVNYMSKGKFKGNFKNVEKFKHNDEASWHYSYDTTSDTYFSNHYDEVGEEKRYSVWYLNSGEAQWKELFTTTDGKITFAILARLSETEFSVASNIKSDRVAVYAYNVETATFGDVLYEHERYDIVDASVDDATGELVSVSYYEHGRYSTRYLADAVTPNSAKLKKAFPDKQLVTLSAPKGASKSVIGVYSNDDAGAIYLNDHTAKTLSLIDYKYPDLVDADMAKTEVVTVEVEPGVTLEGYLTRPGNNDNGVLLVMPHGGPIGIRDYNNFNPEVQYFANRGYTLLRVNFRGSKGFGRSFSEAGLTQFGALIEHDIGLVVDEVKQRYGYERACAMGSSYGGYSAALLTIRNPEFYHCGVAMYGVYDLPLIFNASKIKASKESREIFTRIVGSDMDALKALSPLYFAQELQRPLLLIAGKRDTVADFEHSNRMKYVLDVLGKDYEYLFYPRVRHGQPTYYGDRHQSALIDDFIRRKLHLDRFTDGPFAETVGKESMLLAKSFGEGRDLADPKREQYFLDKAALTGNDEAKEALGLGFEGEEADTEADTEGPSAEDLSPAMEN